MESIIAFLFTGTGIGLVLFLIAFWVAPALSGTNSSSAQEERTQQTASQEGAGQEGARSRSEPEGGPRPAPSSTRTMDRLPD